MARVVVVVALVGCLVPGARAFGDYKSDGVFDEAFLEDYCGVTAQKLIARTTLEAETVEFPELTGFVEDGLATPYDGNEAAPLTAPQYVGAEQVLCKVKSWDALVEYYGDGAASEGGTCSDVNREIVDLAYAGYAPYFAVPRGDIVFDDWPAFTGQEWSTQLPGVGAYVSASDGLVHIVGKAIAVERTNPSPFVGPERKGVVNCASVHPAYLWKLLVEGPAAVAPVCEAPPNYTGNPFAPIPLWDCPPGSTS